MRHSLFIAAVGLSASLLSTNSMAEHAGHKPADRISEHGERRCQKAKGHYGKKRGCPRAKLRRFLNKVDATPAQREAIRGEIRPLMGEMRATRHQLRKARKEMHQLDPMAADYTASASALADKIGALKAAKLKLKAQMKQRIAFQLTPEQRATAKAMMMRGKGCCKKGRGMHKCPTKSKPCANKGGTYKCPTKNKPCAKKGGTYKCPTKNKASKPCNKKRTIRHFRR